MNEMIWVSSNKGPSRVVMKPVIDVFWSQTDVSSSIDNSNVKWNLKGLCQVKLNVVKKMLLRKSCEENVVKKFVEENKKHDVPKNIEENRAYWVVFLKTFV